MHELLALLSLVLAPVQFAPMNGWNVGHDRVHACVGLPRSRCAQVSSWASTTPWRDCGDCIPPHRTLAAMKPGGIALQMSLGHDSKRRIPQRLAWPVRLKPREVVGPFEGGPRRVGFASRAGRVADYDASLYVFFGRRHPTAAQLARTNAELRSAKLP